MFIKGNFRLKVGDSTLSERFYPAKIIAAFTAIGLREYANGRIADFVLTIEQPSQTPRPDCPTSHRYGVRVAIPIGRIKLRLLVVST